MSDFVPKGFVHVDDLRLQLTLDLRLASRPPQPHPIFEKFNAKGGSVIVMDVKDGAILTWFRSL